jgi:hypothetical protein
VLADIRSGEYFGEVSFTAMVKKVLLQVRQEKDVLIFLIRNIFLLLDPKKESG